MAVVTFDPVAFAVQYPEFANVPAATLTGNFALATTLLDNTDGSPVSDITQRTQFLWLLVAHLTFLAGYQTYGASTPNTGATPVGRLSSGTEGSVSSSFDYSGPWGQSALWFNQTRYGATYWAMTAAYRRFSYQVTQGESGYSNGTPIGVPLQ